MRIYAERSRVHRHVLIPAVHTHTDSGYPLLKHTYSRGKRVRAAGLPPHASNSRGHVCTMAAGGRSEDLAMGLGSLLSPGPASQIGTSVGWLNPIRAAKCGHLAASRGGPSSPAPF